MELKDLTEKSQVENIEKLSHEFPKGVLIVKHSTRCAISSMALSRLKRSWKMDVEEMPVYYLDILRYRDVSRAVSETFGVQHESPQVLLIKNGSCIYHASHNAIHTAEIEKEALNA